MPVLGLARRAGVGCLLTLVAAMQPAHADKFDGTLPAIQDVQFVGNEHFGSDELAKQMQLEFPSLLHPLRSRPRFRRNTFSRELRRLEMFYGRQGFGGASAWLDSVMTMGEGRSVRLRVRVREGPRTMIREVRFYPQPVFSLDELRKVTPFKAGDPYPFNEALLGRGTRALRLAFLARGYLAVAVRDSSFLSSDSTSARLEYRMDPGPQFTIRAVTIAGNIQTHPGLVRRELRFEPGEVYSYTRVEESQQNLYNTTLFRSVSIREENIDLVNKTVDIAVRLTERQMAFVEGSIGVGRRDEFEGRVTGAWGHRNLFGRGHAIEVRSTLAYNLEKTGNNYFAEQRVRYTQPHLLGSALRLSPELAYTIDQRQENVKLRRLQLDAPLTLKSGRYTTLGFGATAAFTTTTLEKERVTDDLLQTRALSASITRNSSDDLVNPRRGDVRTLTVSRAGFGGDNHFSRATGAYFRYLPFGRYVLALGLRTGWVESYGPSRGPEAADIGIHGVPFEFLFQAGGSTTVRGFNANSLGAPLTVRRRVAGIDSIIATPLNAGTVLLLGNIELRMPMPWLSRWKFGSVLFLDAGNAWEDFDALRRAPFGLQFDKPYSGLDDMRYAYGFGLRYATPVGPVRLDLGFPLKRSGRRHLNIGLGHTF